MSKSFLVSCSLLVLTFSAYAGERPWVPDFSPQCKRDEKLRNNYLDAEQKAVKNSLAEMDKRGLNIIPTPKNLAFAGKDLRVPLKDLTGKITVVADKSSAVAIDMINQKLGQPVAVQELSAGKGLPEISIVLLRKDANANHPLLPADIPDFYQGYVIKTQEENGKRTYVLAGKDYTGLLYAAVTFCKLISAEGDALVLPSVQVSDWPDIRYRDGGGLLYQYRRDFVWNQPTTNTANVKMYIDWLFEHKINITEASTYGGGKRRGLYAPYDAAERKWLQEVSAYAQERGIRVMHMTTTAVGDTANNKDNAAYKDWKCVENRGAYYCWSNDELIKKRAQELTRHLKDTGLTAVFIHSIDTTNSKWQDRCAKCREQFGDDRFTADAHVFNQYRDEIRKSFPDMPVVIVPRPYGGNIDDVYHIETGEMKAKGDLQRFAKALAGDIYICHRCETSRNNNLSWVHAFKQPMFSCVMAWYAYPNLEGRDFTPICRYYRGYNYPLSDEIAQYGVGQSATRDRIQCLGLVEFAWNLNAPGAAEYDNIPAVYADIWDPFGADMSKNKELQALIRRSCDDLFGKQYAKYFYNAFLLFTDSNFTENYQDVVYALQNGYLSSGKGLMPDINDQKCIEYMRRIAENSTQITRDLEAVKKVTADPLVVRAANWLLMKHYPQASLARINMLTLGANQASKKGEHEKAGKLIAEAFKAYDEESAKLKAAWAGIQGQPTDIMNVPAVAPEMQKQRGIMDTIKIKIESREMMAQRRKNRVAEKQAAPATNLPLKVAVFAPDAQGGLTFGRTGLQQQLRGINDISVEEIDNLTLDTMKKYDCVIFPDCKSLGSAKVSVPDIRAYVIDYGGGMYFEHDSCGFNRFPLKDSVFPEIAHVAARIGEPPISTKYKAGERIFKIAKQHPVTEGNLTGTTFEQVYFDHLQLVNETGEIIAEDSYGKPVVIAGQAGNGRVVFNGGITLNVIENKELDQPLTTVEGEIIVNSVRWLAKGKKGTELIMADLKKTDKTLTDRQASVVTFKPQIIPCKPLHNVVLYAQCFNAKDLRAISPKTEVAKADEIGVKWETDENVIINADSYPLIKVVLSFESKEGRGSVSKIVGGEK